ncbi:MAG: pyridoxine 5'-phosphate synthase [Planctomycetes bacterium]|nr:pyridoxine 5'-phosphate synthase [Planctomycetota bacterium]NOG52779.1 pyridoxine 5'-phosphate synthase [Planctomycetota bacterium]
MIELGVNIDHIATIRQARRGLEPDPVWAAVQAELGGADGITFHLREDRRHMQDHDIERLAQVVQTQLNFELAAVDEVIAVACRIQPNMAMLVPERREEVTTEGGLDVAGQRDRIRSIVSRFHDLGIRASAFIDPEVSQIEAAAEAGFDVCELHTGPYALAFEKHRDPLLPPVQQELARIRDGIRCVLDQKMQCNAGHGLNYRNVQYIAAMPGLNELHIGHSIVSRAVFHGMQEAVREMKRLMTEAASTASS